ncbi:ABC transporter permease [Bacillus sp. SCS-151]|uniref:ABC transporter permease n=1 Tax=Nanhaiella sioensis TaxID=3115293 RepID=UPI003978C83D
MKQLVNLELFKIFRQKSLWVALLLVTALLTARIVISEVIIPFPAQVYQVADLQGEMEPVLEKWEGELTEEKVEKAQNVSRSIYEKYEKIWNGNPEIWDDEKIDPINELGIYPGEAAEYFIVDQIAGTKRFVDDIEDNSNGLDRPLKSLDEDDASYKNASLEKKMIDKLNVDTFAYADGARSTISTFKLFLPIMLGITILIGLSSIFVNESSTRMDQLIYSSRYGRGTGVTAKIVASIIYVSIVTVFLSTLSILLNIYKYGINGWDLPIQLLGTFFSEGYALSPYHLTGLSYIIIHLVVMYLVALIFMAFVLIVSALSKNTLVSFIISATIFSLPVAPLNIELWKLVQQYSFINFLSVPEFTSEFHAYNLFGLPVLDPYVHYPIIVLLGVALTLAIYKTIKKKQVL